MPRVNPDTALRVFVRDRWECMMPVCQCPYGRHLEPWRLPEDDWAATVDHIVPRSRGGRNTYANLRAAHRKCNSDYGTRGSAEIAAASRRLRMDEEWAGAGRDRWRELASLLDEPKGDEESDDALRSMGRRRGRAAHAWYARGRGEKLRLG